MLKAKTYLNNAKRWHYRKGEDALVFHWYFMLLWAAAKG